MKCEILDFPFSRQSSGEISQFGATTSRNTQRMVEMKANFGYSRTSAFPLIETNGLQGRAPTGQTAEMRADQHLERERAVDRNNAPRTRGVADIRDRGGKSTGTRPCRASESAPAHAKDICNMPSGVSYQNINIVPAKTKIERCRAP